MATHSSVLAWRIPGMGSLVGCHLWGRRVRHGWSDAAAAAATKGDKGSIPESRRSPGVGNSNPCQYSCLENSMDGEACGGTVHGVTKESDTTEQLNNNLIYSKGREENLSIVFHIRDLTYSVLLQMPRQYLEVTEWNAVQYKDLWSLIFFFYFAAPHSRWGLSSLTQGSNPHPLY